MKIVGITDNTCVEVTQALNGQICLQMWDDKYDETVLEITLSTSQALLLAAALQKAAMTGLSLD